MARWFRVIAFVPLLLAPACLPSAEPVTAPKPAAARADPATAGPAARLPELPCDARTLQLAKQARRTAHQGKCDASRRTLDRIRDRDPRYAAALQSSYALASCRHVPALRPPPGASTTMSPIAPPAT